MEPSNCYIVWSVITGPIAVYRSESLAEKRAEELRVDLVRLGAQDRSVYVQGLNIKE